jgi:eukaryotic-like serine/threonine-protein kinase
MATTFDCPRCRRTLREGARFCTGCGLATAEIVAGTAEETLRVTADEEARRTADPLVGRVLDSKYELVARLGEGGMGAVYRARRLHIGDEVAVKVLHRRLLAEEGAAERFRREARAAAQLQHPNVVTIHDFCEERADGAPAYIVMELVRGVSLRDLLRREGRLAEARAAALMGDVCAAVGQAHRQGVTHRDLKPDNVIVVPPASEGGREFAKVVDFGIAKLRGGTGPLALTRTGALIGTPYYMSPEQCRGENTDARADVYSLGAMLYEMLTGAPPFRADNLADLFAKQLTEAPPPFPARLRVNPALERVCLRALAKDPDQRQEDASALSREIQSALETPAAGLPTPDRASEAESARSDGRETAQTLRFPPAAKPSKKKWAAAGALLTLALVALAAPLIWYMTSAGRATRSDAQSLSNAGRAGATVTTDAGATRPVESEAAQETASVNSSEPGEASVSEGGAASAGGQGLTGAWAGTYGPMNQPATLVIRESRGGKLSGELEQGGVRVAFVGSVDLSTRRVTIKETRVLSGSGWSLGENTGSLSADGKTISGTGSDAVGAQFGMEYQWSFTKR